MIGINSKFTYSQTFFTHSDSTTTDPHVKYGRRPLFLLVWQSTVHTRRKQSALTVALYLWYLPSWLPSVNLVRRFARALHSLSTYHSARYIFAAPHIKGEGPSKAHYHSRLCHQVVLSACFGGTSWTKNASAVLLFLRTYRRRTPNPSRTPRWEQSTTIILLYYRRVS